ncbi:PqqD family peptide modification chaperone [Sphingomonas sp. ZT3P38]|uniref:PqqD family peptide modification chaperone n=1 Tax=Parasphingomonas zepuensis TaxID=3096161 RepID=UPI002FC7560F
MMIRGPGEWICAEANGETVMMGVETGAYVGLNAMGARIWDILTEPHDLETLCAKLVRDFDVTPEICRVETQAFLEILIRQGAVLPT